MATPDEIKLQKGAVATTQEEQTGSQKATALIESLAAGKPSLPTGTTISEKLQLQNVKATSPELIRTAGLSGQITAQTVTAPTTAPIQSPTTGLAGTQFQAPTAQAAQTQTQVERVTGSVPTATAATQTGLTQAAQAAQGTITSDATVKGQLQSLQNEVQTALATGNPLPVWARGAAKATEAALANRGLSASSMAAEALAEGIMNAAIPIAKADADSYKQMIFQNLSNNQQAAITNARAYLQVDMSNLSNKQQANLADINTKQNFLLSDQAAANAAAQFNASTQNEVNQFYEKLSVSIKDQNANRVDAMTKFAEAERTKINAANVQNQIAVNEANAKREDVINRFNAQLKNQREQFNVQNQREIDQSNVVWRRAVNTANTAATNAANQADAQNLLNLSNWALSSLWQQWRDEASWVNTSSENTQNRNHNLAMAALERSTAINLQNSKSRDAMYQMIGQFGFNLLK